MKKNSIIIATILLLITLIATITIDFYYFKDKVYPGVNYYNIDIGGLSLNEIDDVLNNRVTIDNNKVIFEGDTGAYSYKFKELGIDFDTESLFNYAFYLGRSGSFIKNILTRIDINKNDFNIEGNFYKWDSKKLADVFYEILLTEKAEGKSSFLEVRGDRVLIVPGTSKKSIDIHKSIIIFKDELQKQGNQDEYIIPLKIEYTPVSPTVKELLQKGIYARIAKYETKFDSSEKNRSFNIELASQAINNIVLAPGDIFSFNKITEESSIRDNYKEASVIVQGRFVMGLGGGICQVSSTLYNAALLSGLKIVERRNHGLTVSYVPIGRDATIAFGYIDLKFENNLENHILIQSKIIDGILEVSLFGTPNLNQEIIIETDNIEKIQSPTEEKIKADKPPEYRVKISSGKPGYNVTSWRVTMENGAVVNREKLSRDRYKPTPNIYEIGSN